jgi:hypothetical protein
MPREKCLHEGKRRRRRRKKRRRRRRKGKEEEWHTLCLAPRRRG